MSSSNYHPNVSLSQFQGLFDAALNEYSQKTGKDLTMHPLTAMLQNCESSDTVLGILKGQAQLFIRYQDGGRGVRLMRRLKPTIDVLVGLSASGVFEGIGLVMLIKIDIVSFAEVHHHPVESSTSESDICRCWSPARSMCYPFACFPESIILTF